MGLGREEEGKNLIKRLHLYNLLLPGGVSVIPLSAYIGM